MRGFSLLHLHFNCADTVQASSDEALRQANGNEDFAAGSRLTRDRSKIVIKSVISELPEVMIPHPPKL